MDPSLWPLGMYFILVLLMVAGMLIMSYVLGQRHQDRSTGSPYEAGIVSGGLGAESPLVQVLSLSHVFVRVRPRIGFYFFLGGCWPRAWLGSQFH